MQKNEILKILIDIVESLPDPAILFDTEFNFLIKSEYLDKNFCDDFMVDFQSKGLKNNLYEKLTKQNNYHGYTLSTEDKKLSVRIYLRTVTVADLTFQYIYVQIQDITESIQIKFEQEKMLMLQINNDKMHGLAEISAGMSHEINNPLTVIVAKVQYIKNLISNFDSSKTINIVEALDKIHHHSDRITRIIKTLKNFSRNTTEDESDIVPVASIIEDSINLLNEQIKNKGIQIQLNILSDNMNIRCVHSEITQIIVNLIKNSIDALTHTRQPVIRIEIEKNELNKVRLCITDNGSGILPDVRDKIFKSFYTTKSAGSGTGLGLSLSRHLALKNNGRLYLDDKKTETCFCLELNSK